MSETAVLELTPDLPESSANHSARAVLIAIACVSFGSLLLELVLTRLFSVVLFYHFSFLAVSVALLGLGAGGVFAYLKRDWLAGWPAARLGAAFCLLDAAAIVAGLDVVP